MSDSKVDPASGPPDLGPQDLEALRKARLQRLAQDAARARRMGRLSVRDRIGSLLDPGSFTELLEWAQPLRAPQVQSDSLPLASPVDGDGMLIGVGQVQGRPVALIAHDGACGRGSIGRTGAEKACFLIDRAISQGLPLVVLSDSDGARVHEGVDGVLGNARLLGKFAEASGRVPLIWATLGLAGGAAGYAAALCDLVVAVEGRSFLFVTGPQVIRAVTREDTNLEAIGGTALHATRTGLLHGVCQDEPEALSWVRKVLSYLPGCAWNEPAPSVAVEPDCASLEGLLPKEGRKAYDVRPVVERLFDKESFFELSPRYGKSLVTGFARLAGQSVGVLASQPAFMGGVLEEASSIKGARFIRLCAAFNLPIITLVDSPGFLPGVKHEQAGLLLHGAKLISAYTQAAESVPRVCLILRKSCGAASVLSYAGDIVLALPEAQVQAMGTEALLTVAWGEHLSDLDNEARAAEKAALAQMHEDPMAAARVGYVHRFVSPAQARQELVQALRMSRPVTLAPMHQRKLCNVPL